MAVARFPFAFAPAYRIAALPFGVTPSSALVEVSDNELRARFGPWRVRTSVDNIVGVETSGPYRMLTTIGPAHLSFADRGLTMATNGDRGVCIRFREPVPGLEPTGRIRHPGLTVTVADCDGPARVFGGCRRGTWLMIMGGTPGIGGYGHDHQGEPPAN